MDEYIYHYFHGSHIIYSIYNYNPYRLIIYINIDLIALLLNHNDLSILNKNVNMDIDIDTLVQWYT